jgi:hypothetical protein
MFKSKVYPHPSSFTCTFRLSRLAILVGNDLESCKFPACFAVDMNSINYRDDHIDIVGHVTPRRGPPASGNACSHTAARHEELACHDCHNAIH